MTVRLFPDENGRWHIRTTDLSEMLRVPSGELSRLAREGVIPKSTGAGAGSRYDLHAVISAYCSHLRGIRKKPL